MGFRSALFIVPDEGELKALRSAPQFSAFGPLVLVEGATGHSNELIDAVSDRGSRFGVVYISGNLISVSPMRLLQAAREHHLGTPIYLISDIPMLADLELARLGLQGRLAVPRSLEELPVPPLIAVSAFQQAQAAAAQAGAKPAVQGQPADRDYVPVLIEEFFSQGVSPFDVFLRVGAVKYVKVLSANESLELSRALAYHSQGVRELYVRRHSVARCLSYHEMLSRRLLSMPGISAGLKLTQIEMLAMRIEALAASTVLPDKCVEEAGIFVDHLFAIVDQVDMTPQLMAAEFLKRHEHLSHASAVTFLAALLSVPLNVRSPGIRAQLGLAALFHDIALSRLPERLWGESGYGLSEEDRGLYESHPLEAVKLLQGFRELDSIGLQAIEQHHERRDHRGFPKRLGAGDIHLFAEIVGISDELVRALHDGTNIPVQVRLKTFASQMRDSFSVEVLAAFAACFLE